MRTFVYIEPIHQGGAYVGHHEIEMTEEQIIETYYPFWKARMVKKYGEGHYLITPETCVEDWCVLHWATEKSC